MRPDPLVIPPNLASAQTRLRSPRICEAAENPRQVASSSLSSLYWYFSLSPSLLVLLSLLSIGTSLSFSLLVLLSLLLSIGTSLSSLYWYFSLFFSLLVLLSLLLSIGTSLSSLY